MANKLANLFSGRLLCLYHPAVFHNIRSGIIKTKKPPYLVVGLYANAIPNDIQRFSNFFFLLWSICYVYSKERKREKI